MGQLVQKLTAGNTHTGETDRQTCVKPLPTRFRGR